MIETILTEWEDIAEDGGLAARQNGKLLNFGFGIFKEEVVMIIKIHIEDDHLFCAKRVEVAVQDGEMLRRLNQVVTYDLLPEEVVRKSVIDKLNKLVTEEITNYVNKTFLWQENTNSEVLTP